MIMLVNTTPPENVKNTCDILYNVLVLIRFATSRPHEFKRAENEGRF